MTISSISSSSNLAAAYAPPVSQGTQLAQEMKKTVTTDTVSFSKQALRLASDGDTLAQEASESGAERASEKARGKA
jgi:hypothetical protein